MPLPPTAGVTCEPVNMPTRTLISFHAHPDDEALLTGGTLALAAAAGHRVVLVVATDGEAGLASHRGAGLDLGRTRGQELAAAARALGCARVERLSLPDSGWHGSERSGSDVFSRLPIGVAAQRLIQILREEHANTLTIYDPAGGYGHPDHRQVHRVGRYAAAIAGTPTLLEATLPRELLNRVVRIAATVPGVLDSVDPDSFARAFTPRGQITHRIDVRDHLAAKREAMRAHASQATSDIGPRTLALLLRLPRPIFTLVTGHEWFVQRGRTAGHCDDVFSPL
jgi:LmbE family N-acetylglucosaminyl deacetylase